MQTEKTESLKYVGDFLKKIEDDVEFIDKVWSATKPIF